MLPLRTLGALLAIPLLAAGLVACRPATGPAPNPNAPAPGSYAFNILKYCSNSGDRGCIETVLEQEWHNPSEWATIRCVMETESHWTPWARNPSGASGLLQIMLPLHSDMFYAGGYTPSDWSDVRANLRAGWFLSNQGTNLGPWTPDCGI